AFPRLQLLREIQFPIVTELYRATRPVRPLEGDGSTLRVQRLELNRHRNSAADRALRQQIRLTIGGRSLTALRHRLTGWFDLGGDPDGVEEDDSVSDSDT